MSEIFDIRHGNALDQLQEMPAGSVDCCVTSPPYFGLRDYGVEGQIGLENSPETYIANLVSVFAEVHRVMNSNGTLWVNIGDSYNAQPGQRKQGVLRNDVAGWKQQTNSGCLTIGSRSVPGVKPKDLIGIPWMLAFALRSQGWYLRQDIIWHKPNPMPESIKDRCTRAHEYVFMFSKSRRYFYDYEAVSEIAVEASIKKFTDNGVDKQRGHSRRHAGFNGRYAERLQSHGVPSTRNRRSVWTIATCPTPEAHFATFPIDLPEVCIRAGCPVGGLVLDPFSGAATTGLAAIKNGRRYLGVELNADYIEISWQRARKYYPLLVGAA